jgi:hypothetical protein
LIRNLEDDVPIRRKHVNDFQFGSDAKSW